MLCADEVVCSDPFLARRLDGLAMQRGYCETIRGQVSAARLELITAQVTLRGSAAVPTFNSMSWGHDGREQRWNCTEVFRCAADDGRWQLIQTHGSWPLPGSPG